MKDAAQPPVLLVDDDDDSRCILRQVLEAEGYAVVEARDGEAGLHILVSDRAQEPCLIVLDLHMPLMSGWELLAIIKSYNRLSRIPVVVVSAAEPHAETLARGTIAAWVQKPADAGQLASLVKAHARTRHR